MCRPHLLGEHRELHALCGMLSKGISVQGYVDNQLIELRAIGWRHEKLVAEMESRGYSHNTPWNDFNPLIYGEPYGVVNRQLSFMELIDRCPNCCERALAIQSGETAASGLPSFSDAPAEKRSLKKKSTTSASRSSSTTRAR